MLDRLINSVQYLFHPKNWVEYVIKLFVLCSLTTLIALSTETLIGTEISNPWHTYFSIVFILSAPFFSAAMLLTRKLVHVQNELLVLAMQDQLTGLLNRRAFFNILEHSHGGAVLMADADHFKSINDRFGHTVGDIVLVAIADHLRQKTREQDTVGRIGGEEFAIFLSGADRDEAKQIGERLSKGFTIKDNVPEEITVTLSVGLAFSTSETKPAEVLDRADRALYRSKKNGRARLSIWRPTNVLTT